MWDEKILPSRYTALPELTSVGFLDVLQLASTSFTIKSLTNEGDELENGRRKLIHAHGAEARLRLEIAADVALPYTGIFASGADCVIGRFSLASKPTAERSIPALALKIFVTDHTSVNLQLMNSVDGQPGHNFFALAFSNILPPAQSFATRLLDHLFGGVARAFGAADPNPGRLTLEHLAGISADGKIVKRPHTPYQLILQPTAQTQALMQDATAGDDFRTELGKLPSGEVLYDLYVIPEDESPSAAKRLGALRLMSPILASRYGDERLYFQHNMAREGVSNTVSNSTSNSASKPTPRP